MCGITARISLDGLAHSPAPEVEDIEALKKQLSKSLDRIAHRGPDSNGTWISPDGVVGLGHCRLSITDLSSAGQQPIQSDDGMIHAVINGEIYNHDNLRDELARNNGYRFKGRSDSEVVVALYKVFGDPDFFQHLRGEFSLVICDQRHDQTRIIAARDRYGINPLFWAIANQGGAHILLIAAEIKAFLELGWKARWDVQSIIEVLPDGQINHHQYWDAEYNDKLKVETRTLDEMITGVRERLVEAVRLRLRADVPIGIYLSGGVDSSIVAGIVSALVREDDTHLGNIGVQRRENPLGLGSFIIMDWIDHAMNMSDVLNTTGFVIQDRPILDPNIGEAKLELLYRQLAGVLLQLSTLQLPSIGSLVQIDDFTWEVAQRPLSYDMNELVREGTHPRSRLLPANETFQSTSSYFNALADRHLEHLTHQRNDAVDSADDCRRRYTARCLFRKLAREGRLTNSSTDQEPFKIWCDELRPSNVLVNEELQIVGVVDWEFTYAAPVEFSHAPPWWLLLEQLEYWPDGIEAWTEVYEARLQTFLKVLREEEDAAIDCGRLKDEQRFSGPMQQSWESGDFWVAYAARKGFAFDAVFWKKIDGRFFGPATSEEDDRWKERLHLLTDDERADMEKMVEKKMEEMETRVLAWEPDETKPVRWEKFI